MKAFVVGEVYAVRSIGDWNCIWSFRVVARTAKFVTLQELASDLSVPNWSKQIRVGVSVRDGVEKCSPLGRYSMSPTLSADRVGGLGPVPVGVVSTQLVAVTTRDRREARAARLEEWAAKRETKGGAAVEQARAQAAMIPFGQPMLTDHHSYRSDVNRRARTSAKFDRGFADLAKGREMVSKAANIRAAAAGSIFTDDEDAVARLTEKIDKLTAERDRLKAFNVSCRTIEGGDVSLLDDAQRAALVSVHTHCPYQLGKRGEMPSYALTNLGATIRTAQKRLDALRSETIG